MSPVPNTPDTPDAPDQRDPRSLPVSEFFVSVQGEGVRTGVPSAFIRLSGCNLRCRWCDTPHASWSPEFITAAPALAPDLALALAPAVAPLAPGAPLDGSRVPIGRLVQWAVDARVDDVILTGGEPMLFDAVEPLTQALRRAGLRITIETAGTIARAPERLACDLMSISPKLADSTPLPGDPRDPAGTWRARHEQRRLNLSALQSLIDGFPEHQLKFVVSATRDVNEINEIDTLLSQLRGWSPQRVLLMPEGTAPHAPGALRWLVDACIARRWRYCHRVHIDLFGHTRAT